MTQLGLGTVQFGLDYGVTNTRGQIPEAVAADILDCAKRSGIAVLDTAPAYGSAEAALGRLGAAERFRIITKTPYFGSSSAVDIETVLNAAYASLDRLGSPRLEGMLIHHPDDVRGPQAETIFAALIALKEKGLVDSIGISIYDETDLVAFDRLADLDIVQLPLSIVDQRLIRNGTIDLLRNRGIEIHARSIFLQGLLVAEPARIPSHFAVLQPIIDRLNMDCRSLGTDPLTAALAFAKNYVAPEVVIVGVDSVTQLSAIVQAWDRDLDMDWGTYSCPQRDILDPRTWPKSR